MLEILPHYPHLFPSSCKKKTGKSGKHNRLFQISRQVLKVKFETISQIFRTIHFIIFFMNIFNIKNKQLHHLSHIICFLHVEEYL